jgi:ribosome recycling factor
MMHITVALPDEVAQEYYNASEKLKEVLEVGQPDAQTLMRFMLAGFDANDIAAHFDRALRNITGAPMPEETDTWVFSPGFENAP